MTRVKRLPVFSVFVDLRKAFPSVRRQKMLETFCSLNVPCRIVSAFASLLSGNLKRLRINFELTDAFAANMGVGEGSINSLRCFNVAYFSVLSKLNIQPLPDDPLLFDEEAVYYIIFADDLTLFGCNIVNVERCLNELGPALSVLNMSLNKAKTKWMPFLPVNGCSVEVHSRQWIIQIGNDVIECVDRFKFLGFWLDPYLNDSIHTEVICSRLKQAAHAWGANLRRMRCNNLSSLRVYFSAFVSAQLYGSSFLLMNLNVIQEAITIFLRETFSLPASFPFAVAEALLGITPFAVSTLRQRIKYFQKIEADEHSLVFSALVTDRCFLLEHEIGVSYNFVRLQKYFGLYGFGDYSCEPLADMMAAKELEAFRSVLF